MLNISWLHQAGTGAPSWSKTLPAFHVAQCGVPSHLVPVVSALYNLSYQTQLSKCHTPRTTALRGVIHRISLMKSFTVLPVFHCSTPTWSLHSALNSAIILTPLLFLFLSWTAHTCVCVHTYAHPWQSLLPYLASCFLPSLRISASMCSLSFPQGLCNVNEWSREWWGAWQTGEGTAGRKGPVASRP